MRRSTPSSEASPDGVGRRTFPDSLDRDVDDDGDFLHSLGEIQFLRRLRARRRTFDQTAIDAAALRPPHRALQNEFVNDGLDVFLGSLFAGVRERSKLADGRGSRRPKNGAPVTLGAPDRIFAAVALGSQRNRAAAPQFVTLIRPPSHHADALVPIVGSGVSAAHAVVVDMRKLALDGVGIPKRSHPA